MKTWLITLSLVVAMPAWAQGMAPNKDPVPSPSDIRAQRGQDRPDGQAPEDRTPSPSDMAADRRIRVDGDRTTSGIQDPRSASAGGTRPLPAPEAVQGNQQEPLRRY